MWNMFGEGWVPPVLVPRDGGYDTMRDGVLTKRWPDEAPPLSPGASGKRRGGAPSRYHLGTMEVGWAVVVQPRNGKPTENSIRAYVSGEGKRLKRRFKVAKQADGSFQVQRVA